MIRIIIIAMALALSLMGSIGAAAQTPSPSPQADEADVATVTETVTTWLKRAGSSKPEVRLRAWEATTPEFQQFYFGSDPSQFGYERSKVYASGDVTIGENDRFNLDLTMSGFINEHRLYHLQFVVTRDFLIDDFIALPDIQVPDELEATTVRIRMTDTTLKVNHPEFPNNDAVVIQIKNEATAFHFIYVFHLNDGQSADALVQAWMTATEIDAIATPYGSGFVRIENATLTIGLINAEPGTYVITGDREGNSLSGVYATFDITE